MMNSSEIYFRESVYTKEPNAVGILTLAALSMYLHRDEHIVAFTDFHENFDKIWTDTQLLQ
jgi:hypothetical protein